MKITELEQNLKEIREAHGDLPVLMIDNRGKRWASNIIEDVTVVPFPPNASEGQTQFYVVSLCNSGMLD